MMEFSFFHLQSHIHTHTHTHTVPGEGQMHLERGIRKRLLQSQQLVSDPPGQGLDRALRPKAFHSSANPCSRSCWQDGAWHRAGGLSKARMAGQPGGQTDGQRRGRPREQERQGFGPASSTSLDSTAPTGPPRRAWQLRSLEKNHRPKWSYWLCPPLPTGHLPGPPCSQVEARVTI